MLCLIHEQIYASTLTQYFNLTIPFRIFKHKIVNYHDDDDDDDDDVDGDDIGEKHV